MNADLPAAIIVLRRLVTDNEVFETVQYPEFDFHWIGFRDLMPIDQQTFDYLRDTGAVYAESKSNGVAQYRATVAGAEALATWEKEHEEEKAHANRLDIH